MKLLIIEDHKLVCDMLVTSCRDVIRGAKVRCAYAAKEGLQVCREFQPDVVFLDLALPDGDGLDFVSPLIAASPAARIVAVTSSVDEFTLHRAMRIPVHGFIDKNEQTVEALRDAVLTVMDGRQYLSSTVQRLVLAMQKDPEDFSKILSEHEQKLLGLFGEGLGDDEIARQFKISPGTIRIHRSNIKNKLGLHGTPELMRYAQKKGFTRTRSDLLSPPARD